MQAVSPDETYRTTRPTPIRAIGALLIAPNSMPRRMFGVCRGAFEDISACISESREHDARHDAYLERAEGLALRGVHVARINDCTCAARYQSIYRLVKAAQAADQLEDDAVIRAWTTAKRLAACIGNLLSMRRCPRSKTTAGGSR